MVKKRVPLEAVLVFEGLLHVDLCALRALVHSLVDRRVPEQIQPPNGHLGQLLGRVLALRGRPAAGPPFDGLTARRGAHCSRRTRGGRRGGSSRVVVVVQAVRRVAGGRD